jgi:hypothetical protein
MNDKGTVSDGPVKGDGGQNQPQAPLDRNAKLQALGHAAQIFKAIVTIAELIKTILF